MPVVSTFYGIVIAMLFNEHNPPHFHVKYGDYRALVTINDGIVKEIATTGIEYGI